MSSRLAIGWIEVDGGRGSAFAVSERDLLTCRHVVSPPGGDCASQVEFRLPGERPRRAILRDSDLLLDVAWYQMDEGLPPAWQPLSLARERLLEAGGSVAIHGFPMEATTPGLLEQAWVQVSAPDMDILADAPSLKLINVEGRSLHGYSGGPVVGVPDLAVGVALGRAALGMVRWAPPTFDDTEPATLHATRAEDLVERWPDLEAFARMAPVLPFARQIKRFLAHVLGEGAGARPFGGRGALLRRLRAWPGQHGGAPCAVVCAPSGAGKSLLLARLAQDLLRSEIGGPALVFVPASARFGIVSEEAVLRALVARLALAHGDPLQQAMTVAPFALPRLFQTYLEQAPPDGVPLVVMVDALDELTDRGPLLGEVDPDRIHRGNHLLVSARRTAVADNATAWRERLGWASAATLEIDFAGLDLEGVTEAVHALGRPVSDARVGYLAQRIMGLSGGDPLTVGLLLEDLQDVTGPDDPAWLEEDGTLPGLDAYLDRWVADQESIWGDPLGRRGVGPPAVFNLLACAGDPLPRPALFGAGRHLGADTPAVDVGLNDLNRWILVQNSPPNFVLSHPRIAEYRRRRLGGWERQLAHAAVARYYTDLVTRADWAAFDAYGARHALGHLAAADDAAEIHELLRAERSLDGRFVNGWFSVRTTHGRARDFVDDVEQVWSRVAEHANPELHVRYALYLRSVWAIHERVPPAVLAVALGAGVLTESDVRSAVEVRSHPQSRARAYRLLAEGDVAGTTWTEAIAEEVRTALGPEHVDTRAAVLTELAAVAPPDLIGPLMESHFSAFDAKKILSALGNRVPPAELERALELADQISPVVQWARARIPLLLAAGVPRPEIGDWLREETIGATEAEAVGLLVELAKLSGPDDDVVEDIVGRLERLTYDQDLAPAVGWFAALAPAIHAEHLTRVLTRMDWQYRHEDVFGVQRSHPSALAVLGPSLTEDQRHRFVDPVVQDLEPSGPDGSLSAHFGDSWAAPLSPYLSSGRREAGLRRHLKQLVLIVGTPPDAAHSLLEDFPVFDRSIRGAARTALTALDPELVPAAVTAALDLRLDDGRADVLEILLPRCDPGLRRDVLNREMTRLSRIGDEERVDEVVATLVPWCRTEQRGSLAIESVAAAVRAGCRSAGFAVLLGLLPYLDETGREAALEAAFEAIEQIEHGMSAGHALASLAPVLDDERLRRAWQVSGAWERDAHLARAWLVDRYPDGDRRQLVREVLSGMAAAWPVELPEEFLFALAGVATQIHDEDLEILATMIAEAGVADAKHSRRALEILSAHLIPDQVQRLREFCVDAWERLPAKGFSQGDGRLLESLRDDPLIGPSTEADEPSLRQRLSRSLTQTKNGRVAVLEVVGSNTDLLRDLGGEDGVSAVVRAIRDVQRWWP